MIKKLQLKFGPNGRQEKLSIDTGSITIFVGPNNSGKSMILREIESYCQNGHKNNLKIIDEINFILPDEFELMKQIEEMNVPFQQSEQQQPEHVKYGRFNATRGFILHNLNPNSLLQWLKTPANIHNFIQHYVAMFVSRFGGKERFQLIQQKENSDLKSHPTNCLMGLFQNDSKRKEVRSLTLIRG